MVILSNMLQIAFIKGGKSCWNAMNGQITIHFQKGALGKFVTFLTLIFQMHHGL